MGAVSPLASDKARAETTAQDARRCRGPSSGITGYTTVHEADGPCIGEGEAMSQEPAIAHRTSATDIVLKLPLMLGSLPLTMLPFLLPLYAKQFGATALGIGGLFAVAQGMTVLCRPIIGWGVDRWGGRGFCLAGLAGYAGAMGVCALAASLTS